MMQKTFGGFPNATHSSQQFPKKLLREFTKEVLKDSQQGVLIKFPKVVLKDFQEEILKQFPMKSKISSPMNSGTKYSRIRCVQNSQSIYIKDFIEELLEKLLKELIKSLEPLKKPLGATPEQIPGHISKRILRRTFEGNSGGTYILILG